MYSDCTVLLKENEVHSKSTASWFPKYKDEINKNTISYLKSVSPFSVSYLRYIFNF
jgi:hypothetical protein